MSRKNRDKRTVIVAKRSSLPILPMILIIAALLVLGVVIHLVENHWSQSAVRPQTTTVFETGAPAHLNRLPDGFKPVVTQAPDAAIQEVRVFLDWYVRWRYEHLNDSNPPTGEVVGRFKAFIAKLVVLSPEFQRLSVVASQPEPDLALVSEALEQYLSKRGWLASFGTETTTHGGEHILAGWIGRIVGEKSSTVTTFDGRSMPFHAYVVEFESRAAPEGVQAETRKGIVALFSEAAIEQARQIRDVCRESAAGTPCIHGTMKWFAWLQAKDDFVRLGDTEVFQQLFAERALMATFAHELEHVCDMEFQIARQRLDLSAKAYTEIGAYGEARGALAGIVNGDMTFIDFGNVVCVWEKMPGTYGNAAKFVEAAMDDVEVTNAAAIRAAARRGLAKLDRDYYGILRHIKDADPMKGYYQEMSVRR